MTRTPTLILVALAAALLLGACEPTYTPEQQLGQVESFTMYMGFRPDVQFAPFYVGLEKGFFREEGLEITLEHASESDMVRLVGTGEAPFAVVSGEQVLLSRAQGVPIVYVFQWYQRFPVAVAARGDLGITTPADLAGHSVGTPMLEGASYIGLEALLGSAGLTDADIDLQVTGFTQVETLVTGRVEAVVIYASNEPVQLDAQGVDYTLINVADYANLVSNGIITSEKLIAENPDLVRRMAAAFAKAVAYTIENPDEAYSISAKYVEGLDDPGVQAAQKTVLARSIDLWRAERLGASQLEGWETMQEVLLTMGLLDVPQDLSAAYTDAFLP